MSLTPPYNQTRVPAGSEFLVSAVRCALVAIIPEGVTTGTVVIRDANAIGGGATPVHTAAIGMDQRGKSFGDFGVKMSGITITAAADPVTVVWAPF